MHQLLGEVFFHPFESPPCPIHPVCLPQELLLSSRFGLVFERATSIEVVLTRTDCSRVSRVLAADDNDMDDVEACVTWMQDIRRHGFSCLFQVVMLG